MRSTIVRLGALALASFLVLSAAPPRPAAAAGEPYLIGAVLSESGPGSSLGRPEADSVQMAVDEINKAGGVNGHQLQVQIIDDESQATTAVNAVRQLIDKHPIAIIGSSLTQTSLAMVPLTQAASIPLLSLASSAQVIEPVAERKWVFKMPITDTHVATAMQAYMKKQKQTKLAFIYRDDDYGKTGLQHFKDAPDGKSFDIASADAIASTASDATTQLTHAKAAGPQAIVAWTTLPSANVIIKGYRELGLTPPIYYSDGAATGIFVTQAGAALNGAFILSTKINVADLAAQQRSAEEDPHPLHRRFPQGLSQGRGGQHLRRLRLRRGLYHQGRAGARQERRRRQAARRDRAHDVLGRNRNVPHLADRPQRALRRFAGRDQGRQRKVHHRKIGFGRAERASKPLPGLRPGPKMEV